MWYNFREATKGKNMRISTCIVLFMALVASTHPAEAKASPARTVTVDTRTSAGRMNLRLNGGNGYTPIARLSSGGWGTFIKPMADLHLPIVRTHDTILMDDGVKTVDIHMIFANFRADENSPDNYWFKQTDEYLGRAIKEGSKILFRLGESIEHGLVKYFVHPPEDFAKWARICSHIIDHYNNGWADGFHWNIEYWEIWNEPDVRPGCWTGTDEQFFDLYITAAKYLKEKHPGIKVGGAAFAGHRSLYEPFLATVAKVGAPLDFFSIHCYTDNCNWLAREMPRQIRELVDKYGFKKSELVLDEWHYFPCSWNGLENDQPYRKKAYEQLASVEAGAFAAAVMIGWQDSPLDIGCYYTTGPDAVGWGLIERSKRELTDSYWCFKAYCDLMRYPDRVKATAQEPLHALAGRDANGRVGVLVSGLRNRYGDITVQLDHAPKNVSLKAVDWNRQLAATPFKVEGTAVTFNQQGDSAVFLLEFE